MRLRLQAFAADEARILRALTRDLAAVGAARLIVDPASDVTVFVERLRVSIFVLTRSISTPNGSKPTEKLVFCTNAFGELFPVDHVVFGPSGDVLPRSTPNAQGKATALEVHLAHHLAAGTLLRLIEREHGTILKARWTAHETGDAPPPALEPFDGSPVSEDGG